MNATDLFKHTVFINLKHRTDRLNHANKEFAKLDIIPTRFNAIKTKNGAVGCSMSHLACLRMAKANNWPHVFIAEDDICFTNPQLLVQQINLFLTNMQNNWDVLLIAGNNAPPYEKIGDYCVRIGNCRAATGYIVQQHYYDTIINNFKQGLLGLINDPDNKREYACDMYWMRLQAHDLWYLIIPLTVYQLDGYSDIEEKDTDYRLLMIDLDKKWLQTSI